MIKKNKLFIISLIVAAMINLIHFNIFKIQSFHSIAQNRLDKCFRRVGFSEDFSKELSLIFYNLKG